MPPGKGLALLFSILILLNAFGMRRLVGTWLFPACIFAVFWFLFTFLPLAALTDLPIDPRGTAFILCFTLAFSASSLAGFRWRWAFKQNELKAAPEEYFNTRFLRTTLAASSALALVCFAINMRIQGFSFSDLFLHSIETAASYSSRRGQYELTPNIASKIELTFAYLAATLGGLLFGSSKSRRQAALAMTGAFLPAIASLLLESAKGLLFQFIALFFGCVLVTRLFKRKLYLMNASDARRVALAILILVPLTAVSFLSRGLFGVSDASVVAQELPRYFASYAFGHLYAFSDWLSFSTGGQSTVNYAADPSGHGFYTFTPLFKLFGSTREAPAFDDVFVGGNILLGNIYTMFRGLILDFGIVGSMVYAFLSGVVIHLGFYYLLVKRRPVISVAFFIYVIGYFYSSALISFFMYNITPASIALLSLCLAMNNRSRRLGLSISLALSSSVQHESGAL
jgi:oligosaccharide repeat unit polymerase